MEVTHNMNRAEVLRRLQQHKKYTNLTQKEIGNKLGSINDLRSELDRLDRRTAKRSIKKSKKEVALDTNQSLPELPNDVISLITPDLPATTSRLLNKQYNKNIQPKYDEYFVNKAKEYIYNFIVKNWDENNIIGIDSNMRLFDYAAYFEDGINYNDFFKVQKDFVDNLSMNDVIFYKTLINKITNKKLIYVDEENYGFNEVRFIGFSSDGKLILHE
jgi:hypothetical protein